jgi:hypothetical protein
LLLIALPACAEKRSAPEQAKIVRMTEEVDLSTKEVITVEQERHYRFAGGDSTDYRNWRLGDRTIRFRYPPDAKDSIEWRTMRYDAEQNTSPEYPIVLDVYPDAPRYPYIITEVGGTTGSCSEYYRYSYRNGAWHEDMLPETFPTRPANLSFEWKAIGSPPHVTLEDKRRAQADKFKWERIVRRLREVGPDRCLCGYIGNPFKWACRTYLEQLPINSNASLPAITENAPVRGVTLYETDNRSWTLSQTVHDELIGKWTGAVYAKRCEGRVLAVLPIFTYKSLGVPGNRTGMRIAVVKTPNGKPSRVALPFELSQVICGAQEWITISPIYKRPLVVASYSYDGNLVDVKRFALDFAYDGKSRAVIEYEEQTDVIKLTVAEYSYDALTNKSGAMLRQLVYSAVGLAE